MRFIGIDPGRTGAAIAIADDGVTVVASHAWRRQANPPALTLVFPGDVVALEAQYLGENARSLVGLVEWTGRLIATLPPGIVLYRPLASLWRAKVLRRGRLNREAAKQLAIQAAAPHLPPFLQDHPDAAEAWCMARFAWGAHLAGVQP